MSSDDLTRELMKYRKAFQAACDYLKTKDDPPKGHDWQSWFLHFFEEEDEEDVS